MTIIRAIGWLAVLAATAGAWASRRPTDDPFTGLTVVRDAVYSAGDGLPLRLDLLLPHGPPASTRPLVVAVHGGGWTGGSRREYAPQFADLARLGLAVAVIDYRPARPGAPSWDGALQDVREAVGWLLGRADRFRLDADRVATLGTSSGGLLALRAAQEDRRISAAVGLSTPTSLTTLVAGRRLRHEPARDFLGADPTTVPDRAAAASPLEHVVPGDPAVLLIHGEDDAWVPVDQARRLHRVLEAAGCHTRLLVLPAARHGFDLQVGPPFARDLAPVVADFLNGHRATGEESGR